MIVYIHIGVYLSLKGTVQSNNSIISIAEIGETDTSLASSVQNLNNGLQCVSDRRPCCRFEGGQVGGWFFPDGTMVPVEKKGNNPPLYRNRGHDDGTVNLNRANNNVMSPTGLFCCVVPDATGINQTVCISLGKTTVKCMYISYTSMCLLHSGFHCI